MRRSFSYLAISISRYTHLTQPCCHVNVFYTYQVLWSNSSHRRDAAILDDGIQGRFILDVPEDCSVLMPKQEVSIVLPGPIPLSYAYPLITVNHLRLLGHIPNRKYELGLIT